MAKRIVSLCLSILMLVLGTCAMAEGEEASPPDSGNSFFSAGELPANEENEEEASPPDSGNSFFSAGELPADEENEEEVYLPDPGKSLFIAGELLMEDEVMDGISYDVYEYIAEKSASTSLASNSSLWVYSINAEKAGFTWSELDEKSDYNGMRGSIWYSIERDGLTAQLCASGSYFASSFTVTLYVPEGMPFDLEEEVEGRNSFQNAPFGVEGVDGRNSFQNAPFDVEGVDGAFLNEPFVDPYSPYIPSSPGMVTCVACHGTGSCGTCRGAGTWRNPYTGDWLVCTACDDGVCSICDGTGYWGD